MEEQKKERGKYCAEQRGAVLLIKDKGELTTATEKKFTLSEIKMLCKWKKIKIASSKKRDLVDAYVAAPKPKIQKVWCRSEEAALQALKKEDVPQKQTALGVATTQMARAVENNLAQLDAQTMASLKTAIASYEDKQSQEESRAE